MLSKNNSISYFTLVFDDTIHKDGCKEEEDEKVDAGGEVGVEGKEDQYNQTQVRVDTEKGKALSELVEPIILARGKSFETHSLFLESSSNPLPLNGEAYNYTGATLHVKERVSTCKKTRFTETLELYEKRVSGNDLSVDELILVDTWQEIITATDEMSDRLKAQQYAIWELFKSEAEFIKDVQSVIQIFQNSSKMIQNGGCMTEVDGELIFSNIIEIYEVNVTFWRRLKQVVDEAKGLNEPISADRLIEAFAGFEQLFQPYIPFCNADTLKLKTPVTTPTSPGPTEQYIQWCDSAGTCKRITMTGFLMKPLQRVTKYSILLKAVLAKTDNDDVRSKMEEMTSRIERFVSKINKYVHLRQEQEKLNSVVSRFAAYTPVILNNDESDHILKEFCNLNLKGPIPGLPENEKRFILKEGPIKVLEKQGKKEVYGFLFSDVFVLAKLKKSTDKYSIHKPPYRLNKIRVEELKDSGQLLFIYLNEYGVVADAFVLQVKTEEQMKWKNALIAAKENYELTRSKYAFQLDCWDEESLAASLSNDVENMIPVKIQKQLSKQSSNVSGASCDADKKTEFRPELLKGKTSIEEGIEEEDGDVVTESVVKVTSETNDDIKKGDCDSYVDVGMLILIGFLVLLLNVILSNIMQWFNR